MTATVVSDSSFNGQNARAGGSFKDGKYIRRVQIEDGGLVVFYSTENEAVHSFRWYDPATGRAYNGRGNVSNPQNRANLEDYRRFTIRTISVEHSAISGKVILILGGYTSDTNDAREVTISTEYTIKPEEHYTG